MIRLVKFEANLKIYLEDGKYLLQCPRGVEFPMKHLWTFRYAASPPYFYLYDMLLQFKHTEKVWDTLYVLVCASVFTVSFLLICRVCRDGASTRLTGAAVRFLPGDSLYEHAALLTGNRLR